MGVANSFHLRPSAVREEQGNLYICTRVHHVGVANSSLLRPSAVRKEQGHCDEY